MASRNMSNYSVTRWFIRYHFDMELFWCCC